MSRVHHEEQRGYSHDLHWQLGHTPVSALMKPSLTADPNDDVEALIALLLGRGLECVPVVGEHKEPLGMIYALDLLRHVDERADTEEEVEEPVPLRGELRSGFHVHTITHACAAEVMRPIAITFVENQAITVAAWLLGVEQAVWAPVVSRRGRFVGMLSALDVLRWIAAADGVRPSDA